MVFIETFSVNDPGLHVDVEVDVVLVVDLDSDGGVDLGVAR